MNRFNKRQRPEQENVVKKSTKERLRETLLRRRLNEVCDEIAVDIKKKLKKKKLIFTQPMTKELFKTFVLLGAKYGNKYTISQAFVNSLYKIWTEYSTIELYTETNPNPPIAMKFFFHAMNAKQKELLSS